MLKFKTKIVASLFILCVMAMTSFAMNNPPNGFRDFYWGETLQAVQENHKVFYGHYNPEDNSVSYLYKFANNDSISGVPINGFTGLNFWNNQLESIYIMDMENTDSEASDKFDKLLDAMTTLYGTPDENEHQDAWWYSDNVVIRLYTKPYASRYYVDINIYNVPLTTAAKKDTASKGW